MSWKCTTVHRLEHINGGIAKTIFTFVSLDKDSDESRELTVSGDSALFALGGTYAAEALDAVSAPPKAEAPAGAPAPAPVEPPAEDQDPDKPEDPAPAA